MRIGIIASDAEYRLNEPFQNLFIFGILIVFQIRKFKKFWKLKKFPVWKISQYPKFYNFEN